MRLSQHNEYFLQRITAAASSLDAEQGAPDGTALAALGLATFQPGDPRADGDQLRRAATTLFASLDKDNPARDELRDLVKANRNAPLEGPIVPFPIHAPAPPRNLKRKAEEKEKESEDGEPSLDLQRLPGLPRSEEEEEGERQRKIQKLVSSTSSLDASAGNGEIPCPVASAWATCADDRFPNAAIERRTRGDSEEFRFPEQDPDRVYRRDDLLTDDLYERLDDDQLVLDPRDLRTYRRAGSAAAPGVGKQLLFQDAAGAWLVYDGQQHRFIRHDLLNDFQNGDLLYGVEPERKKVRPLLKEKGIGLITADQVNHHYLSDSDADLEDFDLKGYRDFIAAYPARADGAKPVYDKAFATAKPASHRGPANELAVKQRRSCKAILAFVAQGHAVPGARIRFLIESIKQDSAFTRSEVRHAQKYFPGSDRIVFYRSDGQRLAAPPGWWQGGNDNNGQP